MLYRLALCLWLLLPACRNEAAPRALPAAAPAAMPADTAAAPELPLPDVPQTLRTPAERAAYIIRHFWDAMAFDDTLRSYDRAFMEQNFSNFISVFPYADDAARHDAVGSLLRRAEADRRAYVLLAEVAEKYLYEPDSPMLSEEIYLLFLEGLLQSSVLTPDERVRPRWQWEAARKNRPGMLAADFAYTARDGQFATLHRTPAAALQLLVFYDPDCEHCAEVMADLQADALVRRMVAAGQLAVVAVYSGEAKDLWSATAHALPAEWTVGYEPGTLQENGSYVLRTLPTLYLLDNRHRVVLKDARPETLREYLTDRQ